MIKLSDFDYMLPKELIAQFPLKQRDESRMLILDRKTGKTEHGHFYNLSDYLNKYDAVVLNDTKVFKARLIGNRKGYSGRIELLLLRKDKAGIFECLAMPAKKMPAGTRLEFDDGRLKAQVVDAKDEIRFVKFNNGNLSHFDKIGFVPLPPYIKRSPQPEDETQYQTIYAKRPGAVAAPTAGLHFTDSVMDKIKKKGVKTVYITLHVGYGTFRPVDTDNIKDHKMHSEHFEISEKSADEINKTKQNNGKILAVGTTVCRTLESATVLNAEKGETDLFIYPGYRFKMTDMVLTNFHLPRTTLLMLVCAFGGYDNVMKAYREAIEQKYRFYSYGDCMLII